MFYFKDIFSSNADSERRSEKTTADAIDKQRDISADIILFGKLNFPCYDSFKKVFISKTSTTNRSIEDLL